MMNALFVTSEAAPFSKTGGLGDVCGALPRELARLGTHPVVIIPNFRQAGEAGVPLEPTGLIIELPIGQKLIRGEILRSYLPHSDVVVYLVDQPDYYDRPQPYRAAGEDYQDNCERFTFFCRAAVEVIELLGLDIDVVHCHDWCAGLVPIYLKTLYKERPALAGLPSIFTIHNLAYQGNFWHWDMALTGLDWKHFNWREMEFHGHLSFLKTGIIFADLLTTVSPTYAQEILRPPLSCGMEGALEYRRRDLTGILNGVDYAEWDPRHDPYIEPHQYGVDAFVEGKAACKTDLQRRLGLPLRPEIPLIVAVSRLADQKGFDIACRVIRQWAQQVDAQWAILGTGEAKYHETLRKLAADFPERIAVRLEFSPELAHRFEAGGDLFLMPSQYEPCGLNQLYSLRYGTVPVVRATGGLADTVVDANERNLINGTATGFAFSEYTALALASCLERACRTFADRVAWKQIVQTGMRQDWSWQRSARAYLQLYERCNLRVRQEIGA